MTLGNWERDLAYSLRRRAVDEFLERSVGALAPGTRLLDVGGHRGPRRGRFDAARHRISRVTTNISTGKPPDVQSDALALPFRDQAFGAVLMAEVIEHVRAPAVALAEAARVLAPGGVLIATAPFLFPVHGDPEDHTRFTEHGWRVQLANAGLKIEALEPQGRFFAVLAEMLRTWATQGIEGGGLMTRTRRRALAELTCFLRARVDAWDAAGGAALNAFTTGYGIVARR